MAVILTNEHLEYAGIWWVPDHPRSKLQGTLTFKRSEGGTLKLVMYKRNTLKIPETMTFKIILGLSSGGEKITLIDCTVKEINEYLHESIRTFGVEILVRQVLLGAHFEKPKDIRFKSIWINFLHVDDWVDVSGFDSTPPYKLDSIKYAKPEDLHFNVSKSLKISISFSVTRSPFSKPQKEMYIKQGVLIGITLSPSATLDDYWNTIYHVQNLLTLAMMKPTYPLSIEGIPKKSGSYVKVFSRSYAAAATEDKLRSWEMLFTFTNVSEHFETLLKNWFKKTELLEPVFDLFFGTLYISRIYLTTEFLNFVQALESYLRRTMKGYELPRAEHRKRIRKILDYAPDEYRTWLKTKLNYSNEPTLRMRLERFLGDIPKSLEDIIHDKEVFIRNAVDTRNYLTHYDKKLEEKAVKGEELYKLTLRLNILLQLCLLRELGFKPKKIEEMISHLINRFSILREKVLPQTQQTTRKDHPPD